MSTPAPVLVLGPPGLDLAPVAAMLADGTGLDGIDLDGIDLDGGDVVTGPPLVASVHAALLAGMDADWTCPPARVDVDPSAVDVLATMLDHVASEGRRWLVATPGTVFLLALWTRVAPALHLVGVRDDPDRLIDVLGRRGLARAEADDLLRAHRQRLDALVEHLDVPVLDLGTIATHTDDAPVSVPGSTPTPIPGFDPGTPVASEAVATVDRAAAADHPWLVRSVGPQAARRRAGAWTAVPRALHPAVEVCRRARVAVDRVVEPPGAAVVEAADLGAVHTGLVRAAAELGGPAAVVVLSDALTWVGPDDLPGLFRLVHAHLDAVGLVVLQATAGDRREARARGRGVDDDDVVRAAADAGLALVDQRQGADDARRWRFVVDRDVEVRATVVEARRVAGGRLVHVADLPEGVPPGSGSGGSPIQVQATGPVGDWQRRYERLRGRRSVDATLRSVEALRSAADWVTRRGRRGSN